MVGGGGGRIRTCSCLGVYKIIGAGRNVFAAIIICSLVSAERGITFFTVSCVSELLGLLEHAEHLGHIVRDCNTCRKWIFEREYSPACTHRAKLPVFWFTVSHGPIFFWKWSGLQRGYVTSTWCAAVTDATSQTEKKKAMHSLSRRLKKLYAFPIEYIIYTVRSASSRRATHYLLC